MQMISWYNNRNSQTRWNQAEHGKLVASMDFFDCAENLADVSKNSSNPLMSGCFVIKEENPPSFMHFRLVPKYSAKYFL